jgi:hypothetical protein
MNFLKKNWVFVIASIVVFCAAIVVFLDGRTPVESIKIYRTTQPILSPATTAETSAEKTDIATQHGHKHDPGHGYSHETVPHAHAEETNTYSGVHDWRDDSAFDSSQHKTDPWKTLDAEETGTETTNGSDVENDLPQDWYKTQDPELYAEYFRAQLIKQFGDIPEVHILADTTLKIRQNMPLTQEEYIADLEAQYALWLDERTLQVLERVKSEGRHGYIIFSEGSE